jgi:methylenetetrahydrofolate/methylenetetrahydromethanopterin dehydrogenase (NADP+)
MDKKRILIQLDADPQPSVFDRVVAIDAGAEEVFSYGAVKPEQVEAMVHGAIFTRGPKDLKHTAFFIGGSDVAAADKLLQAVKKHILPQFGLRVSVLLDANGANTTAVAGVRAVARHVPLAGTCCLVLGGTGPVGQRAARLLARQGSRVRLASRQLDRARKAADEVSTIVGNNSVTPVASGSDAELEAALVDAQVVIAAGAAGITLLPKAAREKATSLRVLVDLNAVPPLGIEGVQIADRGAERDGCYAYGALGVGATKMKVHKAAIAKLFTTNDAILDAEEVYELAGTVE